MSEIGPPTSILLDSNKHLVLAEYDKYTLIFDNNMPDKILIGAIVKSKEYKFGKDEIMLGSKIDAVQEAYKGVKREPLMIDTYIENVFNDKTTGAKPGTSVYVLFTYDDSDCVDSIYFIMYEYKTSLDYLKELSI